MPCSPDQSSSACDDTSREIRVSTASGSRSPLPLALAWIEEELNDLSTRDLLRKPKLRTGRQGRSVVLDGRTLVNFGSNDYLGYAGDVRLIKAASKAACSEGFGAGGSPLVSGQSQAHRKLEEDIALLLQTDRAILFSSGYAANVATISALVGPGDLIASDERNHASLIDGCRLSNAEVLIYPHRDMSHLETLLSGVKTARRKLIVTDSVFSMDGTRAALDDLAAIASKHRAIFMVDEAHATGVYGLRGSGLVEATGTADGVHVRVGTLSKALGSAGGFVAGPSQFMEWLSHKARSWIFSTAHPPAVAAAASCAIQLLQREPSRRIDLLARSREFARRIASLLHDDAFAAWDTQIVPIVCHTAHAAVNMSLRLAEKGLYVPAIRPPSVPHGKSLVRVSLSSQHTTEDLENLALAVHAVRGSSC